MNLQTTNYKLQTAPCAERTGQVAMSLIFLMGGIMIIIGATLTFVIVSFLNSTYGFRDVNQALSVAQSGVNDALVQLERDKDFTTSTLTYCVPNVGNPPCGASAATVSVTKDSPAAGEMTIVSSASANSRQRNIQAVVSVSSAGQVQLLSWEILQ